MIFINFITGNYDLRAHKLQNIIFLSCTVIFLNFNLSEDSIADPCLWGSKWGECPRAAKLVTF